MSVENNVTCNLSFIIRWWW